MLDLRDTVHLVRIVTLSVFSSLANTRPNFSVDWDLLWEPPGHFFMFEASCLLGATNVHQMCLYVTYPIIWLMYAEWQKAVDHKFILKNVLSLPFNASTVA